LSPTEGGRLTEADRTTLATVLDRLIPAVDDLPAAGEMGLVKEIERRARRNHRLRGALIAVTDALSLDLSAHAAGGFNALESEAQIESIEEIERSIPDKFVLFLQLVYTIYYMEKTVLEHIGWTTGPVQPAGFDIEPFDEAILVNARQREPFWRKTE
jgi:hypothetical protein